jgi:hypothetical protein
MKNKKQLKVGSLVRLVDSPSCRIEHFAEDFKALGVVVDTRRRTSVYSENVLIQLSSGPVFWAAEKNLEVLA